MISSEMRRRRRRPPRKCFGQVLFSHKMFGNNGQGDDGGIIILCLLLQRSRARFSIFTRRAISIPGNGNDSRRIGTGRKKLKCLLLSRHPPQLLFELWWDSRLSLDLWKAMCTFEQLTTLPTKICVKIYCVFVSTLAVVKNQRDNNKLV